MFCTTEESIIISKIRDFIILNEYEQVVNKNVE